MKRINISMQEDVWEDIQRMLRELKSIGISINLSRIATTEMHLQLSKIYKAIRDEQ